MGVLSLRPPGSSKRSPLIAVALVAVVALIAVALVRMGGDSGSGTGTSSLRFQIGTVKVARVGGEVGPSAADAVLPEIQGVMKSFYQEAFLNPENWKQGTYDSAWQAFRPSAVEGAKVHADTLTLGADAGDVYASIEPRTSLFGLRVLMNKQGKPLSAFALVTFGADAETKAGEKIVVISTGRYSLAPSDDTWKITGFQVSRDDRDPGVVPSTPTPSPTVGLAHPVESFPAYEGSSPVNILAIGDSYRAGQSHLADSVHVISIDPATGGATVLGIPRDSWVPIPGHGSQKINEAFALGGPELMISTVEDLTGLTMDYYAVTTFQGFMSLIKEVGGLSMKIPYDIHDTGSKANFGKGRTTLSGKDALRLARARYDVPNGDFSRQYNEGLIMLALLGQFRKQFQSDPSVILDWVATGMSNVETDLPFEHILGMAYLASKVRPEDVTNLVVPGQIDTFRGQSIVRVLPAAQAIFDDMKDNGRLDQPHDGANV